MALSDFQKKKLSYIYSTFYDVNNDGKVDWDDFICALQKVSSLNGWGADSQNHRQAQETLELVWKSLKQYADKNSDNQVSKEEWFQMWSDCIKSVLNDKTFPFWLSSYMSFMFDAADTSGDNVIDKNEYRAAYAAFGVSAEACDSAFDTFTEHGKVKLDREAYNTLWQEFFLSNDTNAKGNQLFGSHNF